MKYASLLFLVFLWSVISCKKEEISEVEVNAELEEFLLFKDHISLNDLIGEWEWDKSNVGFSGPVIITPESEGYRSTITFENDRIFREQIDSELSFETYFRIDSSDDPIYAPYTIYLFNNDKFKADHFRYDKPVLRFNLLGSDKSVLVIHETTIDITGHSGIHTHTYYKQ